MAIDLKLYVTGAILSLVCVYTTFLIQLYIISISTQLYQQERKKNYVNNKSDEYGTYLFKTTHTINLNSI